MPAPPSPASSSRTATNRRTAVGEHAPPAACRQNEEDQNRKRRSSRGRGHNGARLIAGVVVPPAANVCTVNVTTAVGLTCCGLAAQVMSSCVGTAHTTWTRSLYPPRPVTTNEADPDEPLTMVRLVGGLVGDGVIEKSCTSMVTGFEVPGAK